MNFLSYYSVEINIPADLTNSPSDLVGAFSWVPDKIPNMLVRSIYMTAILSLTDASIGGDPIHFDSYCVAAVRVPTVTDPIVPVVRGLSLFPPATLVSNGAYIRVDTIKAWEGGLLVPGNSGLLFSIEGFLVPEIYLSTPARFADINSPFAYVSITIGYEILPKLAT